MSTHDDELTAEEMHMVRVMRAIVVEEVEHVRSSMLSKADVAEAVTEGMRRLLKDDHVITEFWTHGFRHLTKHTTDGAQVWIGRRIVIGIASALLTAAVYFAAKMGTLK
jgi:hypothetical protein